MGADAGAALVDGIQATPLLPPVAPVAPSAPPLDHAIAEAGASLTTDLANDAAVMMGELYALHHLGDATIAQAAAQKLRMKPEREKRIQGSICRWAEANPEKATKFFGFLVLVDPALWLGDIVRQMRAIAEQGKQLRGQKAEVRSQPASYPPPLPTPIIN